MRIGLFGLGLIGRAVAGRLIARGWDVTGTDPSEEARLAFSGLGGRVAEAVEVMRCDIVVLAVFDAAEARAVLAGRPGDCTPDVMVMTTCDPEGIASLLTLAGPCALVEAPVSGTSAQLARGEATIWLAGQAAAMARVRPVAECLAHKVVVLERFGDGAKVKLCVNLVLGLNRAALAEGLVLARGLGLDPHRFLDLARQSAAASAVMATKGPRMVTGDFSPEGRVVQSAKDFDLILGSARQAGLALPFGALYAGLMQDLIAAGEGNLDNAAIIRAVGQSAAGRTSRSGGAG